MSDTEIIPQVYFRTSLQKLSAIEIINKLQCRDKIFLVMTIKPINRKEEQSRRFHAMCGEVARQAFWMGKPRTLVQWKVLFISGHAIATGLGADVVPGLEGEFCNIRESSAEMGIKRMASLIEYVMAWGIDNGIRWTDPNRDGHLTKQQRERDA